MSELTWTGGRALDRPVLVAAFSGLFDAGSVATGAIDHLIEHLDATPIARIDPENFYDFQQARPRVELLPEGLRRVVWPEIMAHATSSRPGQRDLVLVTGVEPHFRWRTFTELVVEIARRSGAEMIVTLGGNPAQTPHTRPPVVFGSSTNAQLASRLGLSRPQYQGVTGVLGVLQAALDHGTTPAIAMRVDVPHYAAGDVNPKGVMALLRHLEHVTGVGTGHAALTPQVAQWESRLDAAVADDGDARSYVAQLEARYDSLTERQVASGDDIAAELEKFLREQRGDS
ncbi:MAG: PAC2 family protein [Acidimicrobiia bacterium]